MSEFLTTIRDEIKARVDELEPAVKEHDDLTRALTALEGSAPPERAKRGRPRGTGTRANEALEVVGKEPGLSATEIAERMGINKNYLYRVLPALEEDGRVHKQGQGWHLTSA